MHEGLELSAGDNRRSVARTLTVETVFRHKSLVLATFLGVLGLTAAVLFLRERDYYSRVRVFVRKGREMVTVDPTATASGQVLNLSDTQQRELQSMVDMLESRALLEQVVDHLGPAQILNFHDEYTGGSDSPSAIGNTVEALREMLVSVRLADAESDREEAIKQIGESLKVTAEDESNVVSIRMRAKSPKQAQSIARVYLEAFRKQHLGAHRAPGSSNFFEKQTERVKAQLDEATARLRDAKNEAGFASIEGHGTVLQSRLIHVEQSMLNATALRESAVARCADMDSTLERMPQRILGEEVTGLTNTSRDAMRDQLYTFELEKTALESRYSADHPLVVVAREKYQKAKEVFDTEQVAPQEKRILNASYEEIKVSRLLEQAALASAIAQVTELEKQQDDVQDAIRRLNRQEILIVELERQVTLFDMEYRRYMESLEQSRIEEALAADRMSSMNVIQPPSFSDDPIDFSNSLIAVAGFVAAGFAALAAAVGMEQLRGTISSTSDLERELKLPVLLTLP